MICFDSFQLVLLLKRIYAVCVLYLIAIIQYDKIVKKKIGSGCDEFICNVSGSLRLF